MPHGRLTKELRELRQMTTAPGWAGRARTSSRERTVLCVSSAAMTEPSNCGRVQCVCYFFVSCVLNLAVRSITHTLPHVLPPLRDRWWNTHALFLQSCCSFCPKTDPFTTQAAKNKTVCVCVWKLIIKSVCHPVCVILLLSRLQRHEGEVCVLFWCVRVTQVLTPVSPTRLFSLARLWSQNKHQPSHRFPHHFWLRASVTLCFLIFSFNHLYPQEPLHYARLFNCKITV